MRVRLAVDVDGRDAVTQDEAGRCAAGAGLEQLVEEVVETDAVRDDQWASVRSCASSGLGS